MNWPTVPRLAFLSPLAWTFVPEPIVEVWATTSDTLSVIEVAETAVSSWVTLVFVL